jgi:ergothioneine biosynthesis protein EgtB
MALQAEGLPSALVADSTHRLATHFRAVRRYTEHICEPLINEDYVIQSMPDASPVKWHLAHTSWFFETFVLSAMLPDYRLFYPEFGVLFNSYYNAVGPRWPRPERGVLSRPSVAEVYRYRAYVDQHMDTLFRSADTQSSGKLVSVIELGINHEQQHQELILTDLKHALASNPLRPQYQEPRIVSGRALPPFAWQTIQERLGAFGYGGDGFAFDNERPRHRVFQAGFQLANRLVTNAEYLDFIRDGGYDRPEFWLSDGWTARQEHNWTAPLYWERRGTEWFTITLAGAAPLQPAEPVCHISYYEANAFARWANARLPTEGEWETAAASAPLSGHFLESEAFHPLELIADDEQGPLYQMFGTAWQWTASPYVAYPGYHPPDGALGEYNGKFMCNQLVLRGASCVTPRSHARLTYRNFFGPSARWQFTGIRLAQDLE